MISLLPGAAPTRAAELLETAARELRNAQSSASALELYNQYFRWAGEQMRMLTGVMATSELDRLVTTRWHWALSGMNLNQPEATTSPKAAIHSSVTAQITETLRRLEDEAKDLRGELSLWRNGQAAAAVLDTNVLTDHWHRLTLIDWPVTLGVNHTTHVVLAVPVAVIDELDKHKQSNQREPKDSGRADLRDRARSALKWIESKLHNPSMPAALETVARPGVPEFKLSIALIRQDVRHVPLSDTDSEIIDRALSLEGFASRVHLITSDTGMLLRARRAGLPASRPEPEQPDQTE
ncbi:PIN domain-containing protein [Arthrobacter bambusae]